MYALSGLSEATREAAAAAMPRCYSLEFSRDCIDEGNVEGYPGCDVITRAYQEDYDATDAMVNAVPFCSEKKSLGDKLIFAGAGLLAGVLLGVVAS